MASSNNSGRSRETQSKPPSGKTAAPKGRPAAGPAPELLQRALADPASASPPALKTLQRAAGNRSTARLLGRTAGPARVQAKLTVGPAGDRHEQEADRVASEVTRHASPQLPVTNSQAQPPIQRASPEAGFEAGPEVEQELQSRRGGGQPLPDATRETMEPRFGADFGAVRVHTGPDAARLNRQLSAQAFTHGPDIYFGEGKFQPGTGAGDRLLAHELTHVVQQGGAGGALQTKPEVVQRQDDDEEEAPEQVAEPEGEGGEQDEMPMVMKLLQWGFVDKPKGAYRYGRKRGWGKARSGGLAFGEGLLTGTAATVGTAGMAAGGAVALPFAGLGGLLGLAGRGMEKLTNYATGDNDTPVDWSGKTTGQKVKSGLGYVGKGLMAPLGLLGLGVGAAGRGVERLGNYVRGKDDAPVNWAGLSKGEKAKQALKYIGLGLLSPLALPFLGLGALGRALDLPGKARNFKRNTFDTSLQHQREGLIGGGVTGGGAGLGGGLGGLTGFISSLVKGSDYTKMPEQLRQADLALRNRPESESMVSQTGQGFGAAGGILSGLGGLITSVSGIRGLFQERGKKKVTRGAGRLLTGLGQMFAGMTTAGKSIATVAGATSSAAQFMATAALPAQVAMSGVDVLRGGYMGIKAFSRHKELAKLAGLESIANDPQKLELVEFAKEYMKKRGRTAGLNLLSGALGVAGGALLLSGFGSIVGMPLLLGAAVVKLGNMFGPTIRDKLMDKFGKKDDQGRTYSERKKARESDMAEYAASNWGRSDIQRILLAMGMEQKTIDTFSQLPHDRIKATILTMFMRR